jgi:hypothetical protein
MTRNKKRENVPPSDPIVTESNNVIVISTETHHIVKEESLEKVYNKKSAYQVDMVSIDLN